MKYLTILFICLAAQVTLADMIRCKGDIQFWIPKRDGKWHKIEMKGRPFFEDFGSNVGAMKIGKDSRLPAATVYPFHGIEYKIQNKDLRIETDNENWFELVFQDKKLNCQIHQGTAE